MTRLGLGGSIFYSFCNGCLGFKVDMAHACLVVWNREDVSKDKHPHEHFPKHPPVRLHSQSPRPFTSKRLVKFTSKPVCE